MSQVSVDVGAVDIEPDTLQLRLQSMAETHEQIMADIVANGEAAEAALRLSAVRQFDEVDPLESAANEVIGRIKPQT